jgi:hypothetical protein
MLESQVLWSVDHAKHRMRDGLVDTSCPEERSPRGQNHITTIRGTAARGGLRVAEAPVRPEWSWLSICSWVGPLASSGEAGRPAHRGRATEGLSSLGSNGSQGTSH